MAPPETVTNVEAFLNHEGRCATEYDKKVSFQACRFQTMAKTWEEIVFGVYVLIPMETPLSWKGVNQRG